MFTGLIADVGRISAVHRSGSSAKLEIETGLADDGLQPGDSLAVNGACLTVVEVSGNRFGRKRRHGLSGRVTVEAVAETLRRTTLGGVCAGAEVNLERPLRVGDRLDGHWVLGHVDDVGRITEIRPVGDSRIVEIACNHRLMRHIAEKGSIAVDGVSLTVAGINGDAFCVSLVPYTLEACTLGRLAVGDRVNVETDILAKQLERLVHAGAPDENALRNNMDVVGAPKTEKLQSAAGRLDMETLARHGYLD